MAVDHFRIFQIIFVDFSSFSDLGVGVQQVSFFLNSVTQND